MLLPEKTQSLSYAYTGSNGPLIGETIGGMFYRIARTYSENEALVYVPRDERYTYKEFLDVCRKAAKSFMALGIRKGDRLAILLFNNYLRLNFDIPFRFHRILESACLVKS